MMFCSAIEQACFFGLRTKLNFILTAAHYLREFVLEGTPLFVGRDPEEGGLPVPILDSLVHTTDDFEFDVAVIRLSADEARKIGREAQPISLNEISSRPDPAPACYAVLGYPHAWFHRNKEGLQSPALVYLTEVYKGQRIENSDLEFSPERHVVLDFPPEAVRIPTGLPQQLPNQLGMGGISGCGIWRVAGFSPGAVDDWRPEHCKLVAIQHRHGGGRGYVVGTWIRFALDLLFLKHPELINSSKLWYPSK